MRDPETLKNTSMADDDYIVVDPQNPFPGAKGPLERSIGLPYEEAIFLDDIDPNAEQFWFNEPKAGWNNEPKRLKKLETLDESEFDDFRHYGEEVEGRTPLSDVREGGVVMGVVAALLLHHGVQVDIGAEYDGLLPIDEEEWEGLGEVRLQLGQRLEVRVHRVRDPSVFRFPIQLATMDRALQERITKPEDHVAPMDLRVLAKTPEEIAAMSEGQRVWEPKTVRLQFKDEYEYELGHDVHNKEEGDLQFTPKERREMDEKVDAILASLL